MSAAMRSLAWYQAHAGEQQTTTATAEAGRRPAHGHARSQSHYAYSVSPSKGAALARPASGMGMGNGDDHLAQAALLHQQYGVRSASTDAWAAHVAHRLPASSATGLQLQLDAAAAQPAAAGDSAAAAVAAQRRAARAQQQRLGAEWAALGLQPPPDDAPLQLRALSPQTQPPHTARYASPSPSAAPRPGSSSSAHSSYAPHPNSYASPLRPSTARAPSSSPPRTLPSPRWGAQATPPHGQSRGGDAPASAPHRPQGQGHARRSHSTSANEGLYSPPHAHPPVQPAWHSPIPPPFSPSRAAHYQQQQPSPQLPQQQTNRRQAGHSHSHSISYSSPMHPASSMSPPFLGRPATASPRSALQPHAQHHQHRHQQHASLSEGELAMHSGLDREIPMEAGTDQSNSGKVFLVRAGTPSRGAHPAAPMPASFASPGLVSPAPSGPDGSAAAAPMPVPPIPMRGLFYATQHAPRTPRGANLHGGGGGGGGHPHAPGLRQSHGHGAPGHEETKQNEPASGVHDTHYQQQKLQQLLLYAPQHPLAAPAATPQRLAAPPLFSTPLTPPAAVVSPRAYGHPHPHSYPLPYQHAASPRHAHPHVHPHPLPHPRVYDPHAPLDAGELARDPFVHLAHAICCSMLPPEAVPHHLPYVRHLPIEQVHAEVTGTGATAEAGGAGAGADSSASSSFTSPRSRRPRLRTQVGPPPSRLIDLHLSLAQIQTIAARFAGMPAVVLGRQMEPRPRCGVQVEAFVPGYGASAGANPNNPSSSTLAHTKSLLLHFLSTTAVSTPQPQPSRQELWSLLGSLPALVAGGLAYDQAMEMVARCAEIGVRARVVHMQRKGKGNDEDDDDDAKSADRGDGASGSSGPLFSAHLSSLTCYSPVVVWTLAAIFAEKREKAIEEKRAGGANKSGAHPRGAGTNGTAATGTRVETAGSLRPPSLDTHDNAQSDSMRLGVSTGGLTPPDSLDPTSVSPSSSSPSFTPAPGPNQTESPSQALVPFAPTTAVVAHTPTHSTTDASASSTALVPTSPLPSSTTPPASAANSSALSGSSSAASHSGVPLYGAAGSMHLAPYELNSLPRGAQKRALRKEILLLLNQKHYVRNQAGQLAATKAAVDEAQCLLEAEVAALDARSERIHAALAQAQTELLQRTKVAEAKREQEERAIADEKAALASRAESNAAREATLAANAAAVAAQFAAIDQEKQGVLGELEQIEAELGRLSAEKHALAVGEATLHNALASTAAEEERVRALAESLRSAEEKALAEQARLRALDASLRAQESTLAEQRAAQQVDRDQIDKEAAAIREAKAALAAEKEALEAEAARAAAQRAQEGEAELVREAQAKAEVVEERQRVESLWAEMRAGENHVRLARDLEAEEARLQAREAALQSERSEVERERSEVAQQRAADLATLAEEKAALEAARAQMLAEQERVAAWERKVAEEEEQRAQEEKERNERAAQERLEKYKMKRTNKLAALQIGTGTGVDLGASPPPSASVKGSDESAPASAAAPPSEPSTPLLDKRAQALLAFDASVVASSKKMVMTASDIASLTPAQRRRFAETQGAHAEYDEMYRVLLGVSWKQLRRSGPPPIFLVMSLALDKCDRLSLVLGAAPIVEVHTIRGKTSSLVEETEVGRGDSCAFAPLLVDIAAICALQLDRIFMLKITNHSRSAEEPRGIIGETRLNLVELQSRAGTAAAAVPIINLDKQKKEGKKKYTDSGRLIVRDAGLYVDSTHALTHFPSPYPTSVSASDPPQAAGVDSGAAASTVATPPSEKLSSCMVRFEMRATNLSIQGGIGSSLFGGSGTSKDIAPIVELVRWEVPAGGADGAGAGASAAPGCWSATAAYRSEMRLGCNVSFSPVRVGLWELCYGDLARPVLCRLLHDGAAPGDVVSEFEFTVGALLRAPAAETLEYPAGALDKKTNARTGKMIFSHARSFTALKDLRLLCEAAGLVPTAVVKSKENADAPPLGLDAVLEENDAQVARALASGAPVAFNSGDDTPVPLLTGASSMGQSAGMMGLGLGSGTGTGSGSGVGLGSLGGAGASGLMMGTTSVRRGSTLSATDAALKSAKAKTGTQSHKKKRDKDKDKEREKK